MYLVKFRMTFLLFLQIAIMNNTETWQVEMPVSLHKSPFAVTTRQDKNIRLEKKPIAPINNYLKTLKKLRLNCVWK